MRILFVHLFLIFFIFSASSKYISKEKGQKLNQLFKDYYQERLELFPSEATSIGDNRFNDKLEIAISEKHRDNERALYERYFRKIKKFDKTELNSDDLLSYELFVFDMERKIEGFKYPGHFIPINHMFAFPTAFAQLGSGNGVHPFKTQKDYEDFLKRIDAFPEWIDIAIENMRKGIEQNVVTPKIIIEKSISQYENLLNQRFEESTFYNPFKNSSEEISKEVLINLKEKYRTAYNEKINPFYKKLTKFLKNEYLPKTRESIGLSELPNGKEWYEYNTAFFTTSDLTADEIFEIGKEEVNRIFKEMNSLITKNGFKNVQEFLGGMSSNPDITVYSEEKAYVEAYKDLTKFVNPKLKEYFGIIPKAEFDIKPIEAFRASGASDHYSAPSVDGSRPGIFYLNTSSLTQRPRPVLESLFLHEAIPGHHFQIAIAREAEGIPEFRRFGIFNAYVEGWGLYVESMGKELNLYKNDYQKYFRYIFDMLRATRLVVDVGIHHKGWTREEAIKYLQQKNPAIAGTAVNAVDRYIAIPGQALSYKIGEIKIHQLRNKYKNLLGSKFSLKEFHDELLKDGSMPLHNLEMKMDRWSESIN